MSDQTISLLLSCWLNQQTNEYHFRLLRTDTAREITVKDCTFLLRITTDEQGQVMRCQMRHMESGHEAYLQSNAAAISTFFREYIVYDNGDAPPDTT